MKVIAIMSTGAGSCQQYNMNIIQTNLNQNKGSCHHPKELMKVHNVFGGPIVTGNARKNAKLYREICIDVKQKTKGNL